MSPVALFVHRRADHARAVVESLLANDQAHQTRLIVFSDGPRNASETTAVADVRRYLSTIVGFADITITEREGNLGLAGSILTGVTDVLRESGRVIVLEDDTVVAPHFLDYMNDGLDLYTDDDSVASIHGYVYPLGIDLPETFFMRGADCWGWATWSRAWSHFEPDGAALLRRLEESGGLASWDFNGNSGLASLLDQQIAGRVDSWAVRWSAAAFTDGLYTLYPGRPLVHNIGNDGSGRHGGLSSRYDVDLCQGAIDVVRIPIEERPDVHEAFAAFYEVSSDEHGLRRALRWMAGILTPDQRARLVRALPEAIRAQLR